MKRKKKEIDFIDAYEKDDWIYEKKADDKDIEVDEMLSSEYADIIEKRENFMQSISIEDVIVTNQANTSLKKYNAVDNLVVDDDEDDQVEATEQFVNIDYISEQTYDNDEGNDDDILMEESKETVPGAPCYYEAEEEKYDDETIDNNYVEEKIADACNDAVSTTIKETTEETEFASSDEENNDSTDDTVSTSTVEEVKPVEKETLATSSSNDSSEVETDKDSNEEDKSLQLKDSTCYDVVFDDNAGIGDAEEVSSNNDKQDTSGKESVVTDDEVDNPDTEQMLSSPFLSRKSVQTPQKIILYHRRHQGRCQAMTIENARFTAVVLHDRVPHNQAELTLKKGEFVFLSSRVSDDWYAGECRGRKGLVPASYVEMVADDDTSQDTVKAVVIQSFVARNTTELSLFRGNLVNITHRVNHAWYLATIMSGQRGLVPAQHLEIISTNPDQVVPVVDMKKLMDEGKKCGWHDR